MSKIKIERLNTSILRELSLIIRDEVKNPALSTCTIMEVDTSNDLSYAKIYVSFMKNTGKGMQALEKSKGFIRTKLASRLKVRKCPELIFIKDETLDYGNHIEDLIREIHKDD